VSATYKTLALHIRETYTCDLCGAVVVHERVGEGSYVHVPAGVNRVSLYLGDDTPSDADHIILDGLSGCVCDDCLNRPLAEMIPAFRAVQELEEAERKAKREAAKESKP
jgi:hypothetical protein